MKTFQQWVEANKGEYPPQDSKNNPDSKIEKEVSKIGEYKKGNWWKCSDCGHAMPKKPKKCPICGTPSK